MKSLPALVLLLALLVPGCGFPGCGEDAPEHEVEYGEGEGLSVESFTYAVYQILKTSGVPTEIGPVIEKPYFDRKARGLRINGSPVYFLEFSSQEEADAFVGSISQDGLRIGDRTVTETGTPHYFRKGKVVAAYFGERQSTLESLEMALGPQVAGGQSKVEPEIE